MASGEGRIGMATADSGRSPKIVAPYGGREARLGTNPISIAVPSDLEAPFYLDMATSAAAAGEIPAPARPGGENPPRLDTGNGGPQNTGPKKIPQGRGAPAPRGHDGDNGCGLRCGVGVL